jgi:hypothetical protein
VPIVLKSGRLNLLEPSGPVKGCNGVACPLGCDAAKVVLISQTFRRNVAEFSKRRVFNATRSRIIENGVLKAVV